MNPPPLKDIRILDFTWVLAGLTAYPVAGLTACLALQGALEQRRRTGEGSYIDVSGVEATAGLLGMTEAELDKLHEQGVI